MDTAAKAISTAGNLGLLWILLVIVLLMLPKHRHAAMAAMIALAIEFILCNLILKPWAARVRPFDLNPVIDLIISAPTDYSFPSGHTGAAFAFAGAVFFMRHPFRWGFILIAALMSFSRLYLYVHYPSDVLAGLLIGLMCGWLGARIWQRLSLRAKAGSRFQK